MLWGKWRPHDGRSCRRGGGDRPRYMLAARRGAPPEILARASADPWQHEVAFFAAPPEPVDTPSRRAALALLPDGGTVLDVGCGGGVASIALVGRAGHLTGVDQQQNMLDAFAASASAR